MLDLFTTRRPMFLGLWRFRWSALAAGAVTGILGAATVMALPARYEASARVYVDTQSILKPLMQGLAVQPNMDTQVSMMAKTLISFPNLEKVVSMADLDHRTTRPGQREELIRTLNKDIQFRAAGGQNLYSITYRADSPQNASKVVQALLSIFIESNLGDKRRDSDQAIRFVDEQLKLYENKLIEVESALKEFKIRNMDVMPNLAQDAVARNTDLQRELDAARLEMRQLDNSREALRKQLSDEKPSILSASAEASGGLGPREGESRLEAARKRLDELMSRFTDVHPDVINAQRIVAELEEQQAALRRADAASAPRTPGMTAIPNKVYQDLRVSLADVESKLAAARARASEAERRYELSRAVAKTIPKVEAEYVQLTREYDTTKKSHEQLLLRRESAQISGRMDSSGVGEMRIVDPPRATPAPVSPNRPLLLIAVLVMSLGVGTGLAVLRDRLDPVFFDAQSLRTHSQAPLLGTVGMVMDARAEASERRDRLRFMGSVSLFALLFLTAAAVSALLNSGR
jgi:polysaccharide chain length determinant protein (PEP-CTERM system associated)